MHRKVAAALVAAFALAVAGCGGTDEEPLTRAQLVSRVEQACRAATEQVERGAESAGEGGAALLQRAADAQQAMQERIDDLQPPDELSDQWDAYKQGLDQRTDVLARAADSARTDDRALQDANAQLTAITRRLESSAQALGIRGCL